MKKITITMLCSIGLLIAFFLPWVNLVFFTLSGYEIVSISEKLSGFMGDMTSLFGNQSDSGSNMIMLMYLYWLIPISALYNIVIDILGKKTPVYFLSFVFGIIGVIVILIFFKMNDIQLSNLSFGYYLTTIISILGLIFSFIKTDKR